MLGGLEPLFRRWTQPGNIINALAPALWLEWDITDAVKMPFSFATVDPEFPTITNRVLARTQRDELHREVITWMARPPSATEAEIVRLVDQTVPRPGRTLHLAAVTHRGHEEIRCHSLVPRSHLLSWLGQLQWPGDLSVVKDTVRQFGDAVSYVGVQLAIRRDTATGRSHLAPYVGLEYYDPSSPLSSPNWPDLLGRLTRVGLADRAKAAAAMRWYGRETVRLPSESHAVDLQRQFYVKVSQERAVRQAKVYLTIHPRVALFA